MGEPSDDFFDDDSVDNYGHNDKLSPKIGHIGPNGLPCEKCPKDYAVSFCLHWPCSICYKDHGHRVCPYFHFYPRGEPLNPRYEIICPAGHEFNEDKWVCTSCPGKEARIILKWCDICFCHLHGSYECPQDKVAAAKYKLRRDERRSKVYELPLDLKSSDLPTPPGFAKMKEASSKTLKQSHGGVAVAPEHSKYNQCQIPSSSETKPGDFACFNSALSLYEDGIPIASEKIAEGRG